MNNVLTVRFGEPLADHINEGFALQLFGSDLGEFFGQGSLRSEVRLAIIPIELSLKFSKGIVEYIFTR